MPSITHNHSPIVSKLLIFLLLMLPSSLLVPPRQHHQMAAASTNLKMLKINTDLTASVVRHGDDTNNRNNDNTPAHSDAVNHKAIKELTTTTTTTETHICSREEPYVEEIRVPTMQPVRVRTSTWCLEFPPRCSNYKTEMREIIKIQPRNKTRTIRFCCDGYEGNISMNDTVCKPVCRGGCGRGYCHTPDSCSCEAGYTGMHCTQRCDHDHWGVECKEECKCQNGAVCDNKSGLCHCSAGWTGEFCDQICPTGSYGVTCQRTCECANGQCHPKTGACDSNNNNSTTTNSMIESLNSTIVNITNNLDRIAKNIVNIGPTSTAPPTRLIVSDVVQMPTPQPTLPEVIVIKQDEGQHSPKIIVHQPGAGLLGDLHSGAATPPEVIHVITGWPNANESSERKINVASFGGVEYNGAADLARPSNPTATEHDANLLTTILIILLIIIIAIAMSFLYVYRRYHCQRERVQAALAARSSCADTGASGLGDVHLGETGGRGKSYLKPLPDLPGITQMVRNKIEGPEFYDTPSNNSSIKAGYDYVRKESLYSVVCPKSRKVSPDSHLYDEIRYPTAQQQQLQLQLQLQHSQQLQLQQQHRLAQLANNAFVPMATHSEHAVPPLCSASHLAVTSPNTNFLQVPSTLTMQHRQIAHV